MWWWRRLVGCVVVEEVVLQCGGGGGCLAVVEEEVGNCMCLVHKVLVDGREAVSGGRIAPVVSNVYRRYPV